MKRYSFILAGFFLLTHCGLPFPVPEKSENISYKFQDNILHISNNSSQKMQVISVFPAQIEIKQEQESEALSCEHPDRHPDCWKQDCTTKLCLRGIYDDQKEACYINICTDFSIGKKFDIFEPIGQFDQEMSFYITTKNDGSSPLNLLHLGLIVP